MASRSAIVVDNRDVVIIEVTHTISDSFSRSVVPTSTRAWKRSRGYRGGLRFRETVLAPDWTVEDKRCTSFIAFGPSHPAARGALTAYLDARQPDDLG
jgi:hypothetical protein